MAYTNNAGRTLPRVTSSFGDAFKRAVPDAAAHMRLGKFSVVLTHSHDCWLHVAYSDDVLDTVYMRGRNVPRKFVTDTVSDRTRQLNMIEASCRPSHPYYADVCAALRREREHMETM